MLQGSLVIAVALGYIGLLFVVASYGDRARRIGRGGRWQLIYPLSLAIYCTSWTFFGSVGLASRTGFDFLTIYLGPMLMIGLATPLFTWSGCGDALRREHLLPQQPANHRLGHVAGTDERDGFLFRHGHSFAHATPTPSS